MTEGRWITEALLQFSASPIWRTPIENFVDDNCCIFSNESEMQLEYTVVHNEFKKLMDSLLTCFLMELGVSMEAAVEALQSSLEANAETSEGRSEQQAARKLLKYILNAENFLRFHNMMVKRNLELDILANAALSPDGVAMQASAPLAAAVPADETPTSVRMQRIIDVNGDVSEDDALRRALEVSLLDSTVQQQVQAYNDACVQESVDLQVATVELQANREKAQLESALGEQAAQNPSSAEKCRQEIIDRIDKQKEAQIQQIRDDAMSGKGKGRCDDAEPHKADLNSPESPQPAQAPRLAAEAASVSAASSTPAAASVSEAALPSTVQRQTALPSIPYATSASAPESAPKASQNQARSTAVSGTTAKGPTSVPTKEELEKRAQYMREQREKLLARNRASREEQLSTYLENNTSAMTKSSSTALAATGAAKSVTVEIARRLRGDLVDEGRKNSG
ncbi:hypothetical protein, conserved [Leishmania tarentolae]|uniref:Cilia- and flagella-associated protein 36 n=1 Tax=Leishmania tarentolae TaxID=5689 RepID=A0A640KUD0_LEITA|nr:hypothetical protein, conserved [Leishmania tarentolae]